MAFEVGNCDSNEEVAWPVIRGGFVDVFSDKVLLVTDQNLLLFKRSMLVTPGEGRVFIYTEDMSKLMFDVLHTITKPFPHFLLQIAGSLALVAS